MLRILGISTICCALSLDADRLQAVRVAQAQTAFLASDTAASAGSRAEAIVSLNSRAAAVAAIIARDTGPYSDLKPRLRIESPAWLNDAGLVHRAPEASIGYRWVRGVVVDVAQLGPIRTNKLDFPDPDGDSIPNSLDILLGAKKTVLLATPYVETYRTLAYPNGDMPRDEGVCTDVIVRALRNAGYELQSLIQSDRRAAPNAYPAIAKPDRNIDHRRVRNLVVYFRRHVAALPVKKDSSAAIYFPGDVVFFDTLGDSRPDHVGIVSDRLGPSKMPLIINAWTTGYVTQEMDLLGSVRVTDHFRMP